MAKVNINLRESPLSEEFITQARLFMRFHLTKSSGSEKNYEFMELNGTAAYVKYNRFHIEHRPQYVPEPFRSENFYFNEDEY